MAGAGCYAVRGLEYSIVRGHVLTAEVRVWLPGGASIVLWVPAEALADRP